jgi:orotate phosphoribosyltransferase
MTEITKSNVLEVLESRNVILNGHFKLSSGLHSEKYVQCAKIFEDPILSYNIIKILANEVLQTFDRSDFDTILSPAMGGILCGYELAKQLECRNIFVERVDGVFVLKRGFQIKQGERILLVEDVVTTAKSSLEAWYVAEQLGGKLVGIASIINRTSLSLKLAVPLVSVLKLDIQTYKEDELPAHLKSIPWVKPGSRSEKL